MEEKEMTIADAINIVDRACSVFQGSRADHLALQKAMNKIVSVVNEVENKKASQEVIQTTATVEE
jgi:hypothetical protein